MDATFFQLNRSAVMNAVGPYVIVVSGHTSLQRSNDAAYTFEQESNFWWLTGINNPDWQLIIDGETQKSWLVRPHTSETQRIFDGSLSDDEALVISGVDGILEQKQATALLIQLAEKHSKVYTIAKHPHAAHFDFIENPAQQNLRQTLTHIFTKVVDCRQEISRLRAIKQTQELAVIRESVSVTADAFNRVKKLLPTFHHEYDMQAEFDYIFRRNLGSTHAYDPIVATGKNACTLHYSRNISRLDATKLVLVDVGIRYKGYAADITRTYAVGKPTKRQREIHKAVQDAQRNIIELIRPGVSLKRYQIDSDEIMKDALQKVGLLKDRHDAKTFRKYFPHAISHGLGLDVHESLGGYSEFMPGMVLTVEPGIYIPEEEIGVRIEDDILVTETGNENLSAMLSTDL